jgi:plasmid segregation protein ParM
MDRYNYAAVDLGNSFYKAIVSTKGEVREYSMPNAIALFDEEFYEKPYDDEDVLLRDNLIVEVNSSALHEKRDTFYIGKAAARQRNVSLTSLNNQKVDEDRTYTILFGMLAHHAALNSQSDTDVSFEIDQLAVSLPTTQYKERKDTLKSRLIGTHTVYLHKVPGMVAPKEIIVRLHIKDVIVGAEGACAYLALTRDDETLGIKDEALLQETAKGILIGDLGGDSVDFVGIKNNKPVASIEGELFGINQFLDHIIQKVSKYELYKFDSRSELEEKLVAGQSEWYVEPFAGVKKDISKYIIPQLKSLSIKYLEHFDRIRNSSNEIKGAVKYIAVGGAAKIAETHIREAAVKWAERGRPIELYFPPNMEKLNVSGLMILAKLNQLKNNPVHIEYTKS